MAEEKKIATPENTQDILRDDIPATDQELAERALFEGDQITGIPDAKVAEWKEKFKRVFVVFHMGIPYVYRSFSFHEYKDLRNEIFTKLKDKPQANNPEDIFRETAMKKFVLWPENFAELLDDPNATIEGAGTLPAGIPYILGEYLMASSGFMDIEPQIIQ